jgi:hypothetical protein
VIRCLIVLALYLTPLIAEESHFISYGGLSISCPYDCGLLDDPDMDEIAKILNQTAKKLFALSSPLYFGWGPLEDPYPFSAWTIDEDACSRYDWMATNGVYLPDEPRLNLSFSNYPVFTLLPNI